MRRKRGMSLVEVLMAGALTAVVLLPILGIFNFVYSQWYRQSTRGEALQTANLAVDLMATEIGQAMAMEIISTDTIYFILPDDPDGDGIYTPVWQNGQLQYKSGTEVKYYLSNWNGNGNSGTYFWKATRPTGGLLTAILTSWTPNEKWSLIGGTENKRPSVFPNVDSVVFSVPAGFPANTVRITLTVTERDGDADSTVTVTRDVYLANHN